MSGIRDINIRTKLTLITAASAAIALLCVLAAFVMQDLRLVKRVKHEQITSQLTSLSSNLAHALAQQQFDTAVNLLQTVSTTHGIVEAELTDSAGRILVRHVMPVSDRDEFDAVGLRFSSRRFSHPVAWQGEPLGTLQVLISFADVEKRVAYLILYSVLAFAFAIVIAVFVARLVQKIVTQPLLRLNQLTQNVVVSGNYGLRARVRGSDEIAQLGQAINSMLEQIQQRDVMLERQVAQRTQELKRLAEEFRYRALHDALTGLPNRALLTEEFIRAVAHASRVKKHFALILLDLDNFKVVNDSLGHEAGDQVLKCVSKKLRQALRAEDIICRLGGDEFVILIEDLDDNAQVPAVGHSLLATLAEPLWVGGRPITVGLSVGISIYPQHGSTLEELSDNADSAMYRAKHGGKNQFIIYEATPGIPEFSRTLAEEELTRALAEGEFELYYQPLIDLERRRVEGCEALVRWNHAELGLLQPADFIPIAEKCGLMVELDQYVLMHACRDCAQWADELGYALPVSVNLSAVQYQSATLLAGVRAALATAQVRPGLLTLELPESSLAMAHSLRGALAEVRSLGVKLALDNFGLGDFSLLCLQDLPVNRLKLDASFAATISAGNKDNRLIKGVLALATALDVDLVVEGVESQQQEATLRSLGCTLAQGFYYSAPVPANQLLTWLQTFDGTRQLPQAMM